MLPKVATHLLHSTSRAAAVVQNQTHAIRNVLQLQSSGPSSGSNSSWGNGPGPGGSKHNAGSRFYSAFNGAGRTVTQANVITSHDGTLSQSDDTDDSPSRRPILRTNRKHSRSRSSSLSVHFQSPQERTEKLGIFTTCQLHARSRLIFNSQQANYSSLSPPTEPLTIGSPTTHSLPPSQAVRVRRNSTSAADGLELPLLPTFPTRFHSSVAHDTQKAPGPPVSPSSSLSRSPLSTPASPSSPSISPPSLLPSPTASHEESLLQSICEPDPPLVIPTVVEEPPVSVWSRKFDAAKSYHEVTEVVQELRTSEAHRTLEDYHAAIQALRRTLTVELSIQPLKETYCDMLKRSLIPRRSTYVLLTLCLTDHLHLQSNIDRQREATKIIKVAASVVPESSKFQSECHLAALDIFSTYVTLERQQKFVDPQDTSQTKDLCLRLLHSCLRQGDVTGAQAVFDYCKTISERVSGAFYLGLLQTYRRAGFFSGSKDVFEEYVKACENDLIETDKHLSLGEVREPPSLLHLKIYNEMIGTYFHFGSPEKAIELVDQMLNTACQEPLTLLNVIPPPSSSTFTNVIEGFCQIGDVPTAVAWFDKLLPLAHTTHSPHETLGGLPMKPDMRAWLVVLENLSMNFMIDDLNRIFKALVNEIQVQKHLSIPTKLRLTVYSANMAKLPDIDDLKAQEVLEFLVRDVISDALKPAQAFKLLEGVSSAYVARGRSDLAIDLLANAVETHKSSHDQDPAGVIKYLRRLSLALELQVVDRLRLHREILTFARVLQMSRISHELGLKPPPSHILCFLESYEQARANQDATLNDMTISDWERFIQYAEDEPLCPSGNPLDTANRARAIRLDATSRGFAFDVLDAKTEILTRDVAQLNDPVVNTGSEMPVPSPPSLKYGVLQEIDSISQRVAGMLTWSYSRPVADRAILEAYNIVVDGFRRKKSPSASSLGLVIEALGRIHRLQEVHELYLGAQGLISSMKTGSEQSTRSWFQIEDSMVIALAHGGDINAAHQHRAHILEQNGAPSANAYGVLVLVVKDTTDDASNALALFNEALSLAVPPNQYLYNNIISKLSRARKADQALEMFHRMKAEGVPVSSITYGAVIGACARVGDVHSAETLFTEMEKAPNFKARVPPYNTMMQLFTASVPDRERALFYYNKLIEAGVQPTAHTYKLLMDVYGGMEPVDEEAMMNIYHKLSVDRKVSLQGTHFAALINSYGCVKKDLQKAIDLFESIPSVNNAPKLDSIIFEAMFNSIVAHHRTDLITEFMAKMNTAGVHMTAYIANLLIKGHAANGDLDQARVVFESLLDPPIGVAAPNNHAPHHPVDCTPVGHMEPVYREPSTWEMMLRAELGAGHRDRALDLLDRLKARQYPEAVYNRISGIMLDHAPSS